MLQLLIHYQFLTGYLFLIQKMITFWLHIYFMPFLSKIHSSEELAIQTGEGKIQRTVNLEHNYIHIYSYLYFTYILL
jgi:uncharacterized membrane protein